MLGIPKENTQGTQDPWQIASLHSPPPRPHTFLAKLRFSRESAVPAASLVSRTAEARTESG